MYWSAMVWARRWPLPHARVNNTVPQRLHELPECRSGSPQINCVPAVGGHVTKCRQAVGRVQLLHMPFPASLSRDASWPFTCLFMCSDRSYSL
jgi:hypothetical protein